MKNGAVGATPSREIGGAADWAGDVRPRIYGLALLCGLAAGALGSAFHYLCDLSGRWRTELVATGRTPWGPLPSLPALGGAGTPTAWTDLPLAGRIGLLGVGIALVLALARFLVRRYAVEAAGSGIQEIEGFLAGQRPLRWLRLLPVKFVGGVLAIGTGLVLGREGPTVHMGGASGMGVARLFGCSRGEINTLVAAGAGAGLAAAFNAPLAGLIFVIEEMRREVSYSFRGYHAIIIACFAATFVTEKVMGVGPQLALPPANPALATYPLFAVLGIVLGIAGVGFNRGLLVTLDVMAGWSRRAGWSLVLALGLGLASLLLVLPGTVGGGEQIIDPSMFGSLELRTLALLLVVRTVTTLVSYAAGTPGGVFAPMLALGTIVGMLVGRLAHPLLPDTLVDEVGLAIAGMAGLFTATVRAPLTGIILVSELTGGFDMALATTLTCATASLTAAWLGGEPLYEQLLARTRRLARNGAGRQG